MTELTHEELLEQKSVLLKEIQDLELSLQKACETICKSPHEHEWLKDMVAYQPSGIFRVRVSSVSKDGEGSWGDGNFPYVIEMANDRFCEIFRIERETLFACPMITFERIHPDDKDDFIRCRKEAILNLSSFSWEGRLLIKEAVVWIHIKSVPVPTTDNCGDIIFTGIVYDISERVQHEDQMKELIEQLHIALEKIKTMKGFLPICSNCKKIRDDLGFWNSVEIYVAKHTNAEFTHSVCPNCADVRSL